MFEIAFPLPFIYSIVVEHHSKSMSFAIYDLPVVSCSFVLLQLQIIHSAESFDIDQA